MENMISSEWPFRANLFVELCENAGDLRMVILLSLVSLLSIWEKNRQFDRLLASQKRSCSSHKRNECLGRIEGKK